MSIHVAAAPSGDPYKNPELFRWTGSMEGVPDWVDPVETADERLAWAPWQRRGNQLFEMVGSLVPGISIAIALAFAGSALADWFGTRLLGFEKTPVPPILVAILGGLAIRNTIGLPVVYEQGLQLCLKRVLRIGVALLGIRLSLAAVGAIGVFAVPIALVGIATALVLVSLINGWLGLPRRLGTLVAVGTAICGNSAIAATGPVIGANEDEISYAVGCITVFGLVALVTYPFLAHFVFAGDPQLAGFFLGTAIHDTAQVAGAGLLYAQQYGAAETLDTATVTKLVRNLFMVAVIPLMALLYHRNGEEPANATRPKLLEMVPLFVFGFLALAVLRTLGDLGSTPFGGLLSEADWQRAIGAVSRVSAWCLIVAMAAVGLGTNLKRLRSIGLKPLAVGLVAAVTVGVVSASLIHALAPWLIG